MLDSLIAQLAAPDVPPAVVVLAVVGLGAVAFVLSLAVWQGLLIAGSKLEHWAWRRSVRRQRKKVVT